MLMTGMGRLTYLPTRLLLAFPFCHLRSLLA